MEATSIIRSHFWVVSQPFCETVLFLSPQPDLARSGDGTLAEKNLSAALKIFDADGGIVNEAEIALRGEAPMAFELDPLLESCKIESGLRHAHLMIEHTEDIRATCRLQNHSCAVITAASRPLAPERAIFSPVLLSPDRCSLLSLVNYGAEEAQVRVRLMLHNRNPDLVCRVPAYGARVICLENSFEEALVADFSKAKPTPAAPEVLKKAASFVETRGYIRLSMKNEQRVGVQLVESIDRGESGAIFTALSW